MGTTDDIKKGRGYLKDQVELVGFLDEAFKSLGEKIQDAFSDLTDGLEGNLDLTEKMAKAYERDITGSLKKMARSLEGNIGLQLKINRGQNVEKEILRKKEELAERYLKTEVQIQKVFKNRPKDLDKFLGMLKEIKKEQDGLLEGLDDENTEKQKGKNLLELTLNPIKKIADKIDKTGTLSKLLSGNFKDTVTYSRAAQVSAASLVTFFIKGVLELDKLQTGLNRQFGFTDKTAGKIQVRFQNIAKSSDSNFITFRDIHKTMGAIAGVTGIFAGTLRKDVIEGATRSLELMDLNADAVTRLALNAQTTGQHYKDQELSMASGLLSAERTVGVSLDTKKVFEESANATGLIRANLGRNYEHITETVGQAQALGLTLQDLAGISKNLLNFQSSIEAELTAELFIGKQLNLEKARLYALTGDYDKLQKEIMKNVGSEYEFLSMNVLAKEKYAAALGMSVDQMSNLVMKNADLANIERQAREGGRQDIVDEMQKLTLQKEFNKLIEKVQTAFIQMANPDGGLAAIGNIMSGIMSSTNTLYMTLGAIMGLKFGSFILQMWSLAAANSAAATTGLAAWFVANPVAGLAIAAGLGAVIAGGVAQLAKGSSDAEAAVKPRLATGGIVTKKTEAVVGEAGPEAVIPLNEFYNRLEFLFNEQNKIIKMTAPPLQLLMMRNWEVSKWPGK